MSASKCKCGYDIIIGDSYCRKCKSAISNNTSGYATCVINPMSTVEHIGGYGNIAPGDKIKYLLCKSEINDIYFYRVSKLMWDDDKFECITRRRFSDTFKKSCISMQHFEEVACTKEDFDIFKR